MIARFFYSAATSSDCITLQLRWQGETQLGMLHIPADVLEMLEGTEYEHIKTGETLFLPLALGLGVVLAALTLADLRISGDRTAWLTEWGPLEAADLEDETSSPQAHHLRSLSKFDG